MSHADDAHALRVQLATALRERDTEKAALARAVENEKAWCAMAQSREKERDTLRDKVELLRNLLQALLNETHPAMRDIVIAEARAALAGGGDRG